MASKALVLGGNFAGLTAALSVKRELGDDVDVTVVSKSDHFQFNPSFIWIPFGKRKAQGRVVPAGARPSSPTGSSSSTARPRRSTRTPRRSRPPTACTPTTTW